MRILHCIHSLYGGGAERQLCLLAAASDATGMDCAIFCVDAGMPAPEFGHATIFESKQRNSRDIRVFKEMQRAIATFRPHLVHAWLPASITVPTMSVAAWNKVPSILSYRNEQRFRRGLYYAEYLCAWVFTSGVVSNTPVARSARPYRLLYERKQGRTIPNAVCLPDAVRGKNPPELPSPNQRNTLLFVGRLTEQKNWRCLIRALPLINHQLDWRLIICGDGEDKEALTALVGSLGVSEHVEVLGYRADAQAIMRQANLLIMPSWYEGMPNVLMEALALGVPCLASDIPAVRDLVGDSRCLHTFDPASPEALASLIDNALASPRMLIGPRDAGSLLVENYSVQKMSERYKRYYSDVLSRMNNRVT